MQLTLLISFSISALLSSWYFQTSVYYHFIKHFKPSWLGQVILLYLDHSFCMWFPNLLALVFNSSSFYINTNHSHFSLLQSDFCPTTPLKLPFARSTKNSLFQSCDRPVAILLVFSVATAHFSRPYWNTFLFGILGSSDTLSWLASAASSQLFL